MKIRNKIICLALVLLMVIPMLAMATSANTTTYKTYAEAADGELLYKANFAGDSYWNPSKENGSVCADRGDVTSANLTVTVDPENSNKANFTASGSGHNFFGDKINGLLLGEGYNYTVKFTLNATAAKEGFGVLIDGYSGVYVNSDKGRLQKTTGKLTGHDYINYAGSKENQEFAVEVNGMTISLYVKLADGWTKIDSETLTEYGNTNLCLNFYIYNAINTDMSGLAVYKGLAAVALADPAYVEYANAQDGDLLYQLDFNGTAGTFVPSDANGAGWNYSDFAPSADGKSATFNFTTSNEAGENKSRARFSGKFENYTLAGNSYTVEFTLNSTAPVGIALDGGGGFVIQPTTNSTWIGRYGSWAKIGKLEIYEGSFEQIQTYAIEISFPTTTATNYNNIEAYNPTVYRLFVKNAEGTWDLVREVPVDATIQFDFEAAYGYLDFAAIRYNDNFKTDADGNPTTSTVSDVKLYKGIDFIPKSVAETPEDTEPEDTEPTDTTPTDTTPTTPPETFAPPKPVTDAPTETSGDTGAAEESGCASLISGAGIVAAVTGVAALAFASKKRKED